jgi:hypothetical protein
LTAVVVRVDKFDGLDAAVGRFMPQQNPVFRRDYFQP